MSGVIYALSHVCALLCWLLLAFRALRAAHASPGPAPLSASDHAAVFVAAAAARAIGWCAFASTPLYRWPLVDAAYYEDWARGLARGVDLHPVFGVDPLYAHVLGGLYALCGASSLVPVLLGAALGTASALLAHRLCARVSARPVALLVGVAAALHGPALAYDLLRLKSSLSLCLMLALLEAFLAASARRSPWPTLAPGALLGLGALNGAQALFAVPVLAGSLLRRPAGSLRVALLVLPVALSAGWSLAHNARGGDPVPFHAGSGMILWASNNPAGSGRLTALPYVRQDSRFEVADYTAEAERRTGRRLRASEASAYWRAQALACWRADPERALRVEANKLAQLAAAGEWPDNYDFRVLSALLPHLALPLPGWGWVMPLGVIGLLLGARGSAPGARVLSACALCLSVPLLVTYSNARLRLPLLAALWPLSALALDRLARAPGVWLVAGLALIAAAVHLPVELPTIAPGLVGVAEACRRDGLYEQSMELFAQALRADPDNFGALNNLGALALAMGRADAAVQLFQRAVLVRADAPAAWYNLGNAWRRLGRPVEALEAYRRARGGEVPESVLELKRGLALAEAGHGAEAKAALAAALAALERDPAGSSDEERAEGRARLDALH